MKKIFIYLLVILGMLFLSSCDIFGDDIKLNENGFPIIDNTLDLEEYTPKVDDDLFHDKSYYTSKHLNLVTYVNGNYTINRPFTIDKDDENKRIYHNIYFYVEDYFQLIYYKNENSLGNVYAILSDDSDLEYASILYTEKQNAYEIDIVKEGIYDLILDLDTFGIDMVRVSDIDVPVYETIRSCQLNIHVSMDDHTYHNMEYNSETNEYYIEKEIPLDAAITFYSDSHNSNYKINVEDEVIDKIIHWDDILNRARVHVGGVYKIYLHAKTYKMRIELVNPDTASYYCQVEFNKGNELNPVDPNIPYIFEYEFVAEGKPNDPYVLIPALYPTLGFKYKLSIIDEDDLVFIDEYVKESGTYKLTINLKDFTLKVKKIK